MEFQWRTEGAVWILWVLSVPDVVRHDRIMLVWTFGALRCGCLDVGLYSNAVVAGGDVWTGAGRLIGIV